MSQYSISLPTCPDLQDISDYFSTVNVEAGEKLLICQAINDGVIKEFKVQNEQPLILNSIDKPLLRLIADFF